MLAQAEPLHVVLLGCTLNLKRSAILLCRLQQDPGTALVFSQYSIGAARPYCIFRVIKVCHFSKACQRLSNKEDVTSVACKLVVRIDNKTLFRFFYVLVTANKTA